MWCGIGIACTRGGAELAIAAWRDAGVLHVEVVNPGRLQAHDRQGHGVGLAYLRTRIARDHGHRFGLHQDGPHVRARLEIAQ